MRQRGKSGALVDREDAQVRGVIQGRLHRLWRLQHELMPQRPEREIQRVL